MHEVIGPVILDEKPGAQIDDNVYPYASGSILGKTVRYTVSDMDTNVED